MGCESTVYTVHYSAVVVACSGFGLSVLFSFGVIYYTKSYTYRLLLESMTL